MSALNLLPGVFQRGDKLVEQRDASLLQGACVVIKLLCGDVPGAAVIREQGGEVVRQLGEEASERLIEL